MTAYRTYDQLTPFKYSLVMADNPWKFDTWSDKGKGRSPDAHYETMSMDELRSWRVADICTRDAFLWFWATAPMLDEQIGLLKAWGFRYVTMGFWGKITQSSPMRPHMGGGYVLRECGEPFLIGKIGNPPVLDRGIRSLMLSPRRDHSRKPDCAYAAAARLVPEDTFKLDMFSRQIRPGWDQMGFEYDKFPEITEDEGC